MKLQNPEVFENYFNKNCVKVEDFSNKYDKEYSKLKKHKKTFKLLLKVAPYLKDKNFKEYRKKWAFKNGFTLFVIRGYGTYGVEKGLFECAIGDKDGLRYDTKITDDVIENNTSEDILKIGNKVMKLKWKKRKPETK